MPTRDLLGRRAFLGSLAAAPLAGAPARPNIVYILTDDLGWGDVGCYGAKAIPTPNLDRLAAGGMRFTDAHSPSSVCTPTRYGILTGRYSWRTRLKRGVLLGYDAPLIEQGRATVASMLKRHGYYTGCIGKWHLGLEWARKDPAGPAAESNIDFARPVRRGPLTVGFDSFFGISASLDMPPYVFLDNDRAAGLPTAWMEKQGPVRAGVREPGFQTVKVLPELTRKAVEFVERRAAAPRQPFFLYLPLTSPHTPVVPAPEFRGTSRAGEYGDFVHQTDWTVGEVLKALDRAKLAANTLVIFTSDNGSPNLPMTEFNHRPNGPWRGRKSTIWDGGHRIPFLARWPGRIKPGSECAEPICLSDLFATAAALVGEKPRAGAGEDSFSILPALTGRRFSGPLRGPIIHHSIEGMFAVRQWPYKYVQGRGSGGWDGKGEPADPEGQLYDLAADPAERNNLYASRPDLVRRFESVIERIQASGGGYSL